MNSLEFNYVAFYKEFIETAKKLDFKRIKEVNSKVFDNMCYSGTCKLDP